MGGFGIAVFLNTASPIASVDAILAKHYGLTLSIWKDVSKAAH
jgi:hypothetical protein